MIFEVTHTRLKMWMICVPIDLIEDYIDDLHSLVIHDPQHSSPNRLALLKQYR